MLSLKHHPLTRTLQCTNYLLVSNNRRWGFKLDGKAGFTDQVFEFLKQEVHEGRKDIRSITLDEMFNNNHLIFDREK